MDIEDVARRIAEDNRKARERASSRLSRLIDATTSGSPDEFTATIADILGDRSDETSGDDQAPETEGAS